MIAVETSVGRLDRPTLADRGRAAAESLGTLLVLGVLLAIFSATSSSFLTAANVRNMLTQVSVVGVAAIGETIVMLSGGLDLSVGGVVLLSEVLVASLSTNDHVPLALAVAVGIAAGTGIGLLNGFLRAVVGIEPILVTLGTLLVAGGLGELVLNTQYIFPTDPVFTQLVTTNVLFNLPIIVAVMLGLYAVSALAMQMTSFGRSVYALGNNPRAAKLAGLPVVGLTIAVYALGGMFSGIAGFLNAAYVPLVSQNDGMGMQFQVIIAALVGGLSVSSGGVGRVERTLLGVLIIEMIMNYEVLGNVSPAFQQALLGGLLVVSIVVDRLVRGRQS